MSHNCMYPVVALPKWLQEDICITDYFDHGGRFKTQWHQTHWILSLVAQSLKVQDCFSRIECLSEHSKPYTSDLKLADDNANADLIAEKEANRSEMFNHPVNGLVVYRIHAYLASSFVSNSQSLYFLYGCDLVSSLQYVQNKEYCRTIYKSASSREQYLYDGVEPLVHCLDHDKDCFRITTK